MILIQLNCKTQQLYNNSKSLTSWKEERDSEVRREKTHYTRNKSHDENLKMDKAEQTPNSIKTYKAGQKVDNTTMKVFQS